MKLAELYNLHEGKVSDKWASYLEVYESKLARFRDRPVVLLEVGIQNGGSLEIWCRYFPKAKLLVGIDINPNIGLLRYEDARIHLILGDATTETVAAELDRIAPSGFDIIIDDGSHRSSDIVKTFGLLYPRLRSGGLYLTEDLHCSYWHEWEGGLHDPYSSISFFKRLIDVMNVEHWGLQKTSSQELQEFSDRFDVEFDDEMLANIYSIEFFNSLCVIEKRADQLKSLAPRVIVGQVEVVSPTLYARDELFAAPSQSEFQNGLTVPGEAYLHELQMQLDQAILDTQRREEELVHLEKEVELLKTKLEAANAKAKQSLEAEVRAVAHAKALEAHASAYENSLSWRITAPLRLLSAPWFKFRSMLGSATRYVKHYGYRQTLAITTQTWRAHGFSGVMRAIAGLPDNDIISRSGQATDQLPPKPLPAIDKSLRPRVVRSILIIAELSLPQCKKYRVDQKIEELATLGIDATAVPWADTEQCLDLLQFSDQVIFYRVPAFPSVTRLLDECKRLAIKTYWEVDDLIFDDDVLRHSGTMQALEPSIAAGVMEGARLYHSAMARCDAGIASTQALADAMRTAGLQEVHVVENALDAATLELSRTLPRRRKSQEDGCVRIVYGSGTSTHNIDFLQAAEGLAATLRARPQVRFRLIGPLELPPVFDDVMEQVERIAFCDYRKYYELLNECDINIAPLEDYIFNDAKSNIKFIEAAALSMVSVCSPRRTFREVIQHGINGYLCTSPQEWENALSQLVDDEALRTAVGEAARSTVLDLYRPEAVAARQLSPIFKVGEAQNRTRILSVNCYYEPLSYGGATIVAERINELLVHQGRYDVSVLTALSKDYLRDGEVRKYQARGHLCYGLGLGHHVQRIEPTLANDYAQQIEAVFAAVRPHLVHLHAIQGFGDALFDACRRYRVPYIVTAHDFWWVTDNLFFLSTDNLAERVDQVRDERFYVNAMSNAIIPAERIRKLAQASRVLVPSGFSFDMYSAIGLANVEIVPNGVEPPRHKTTRFFGRDIVFGYLGGRSAIKGFPLVVEAFNHLKDDRVSLKIVDPSLALGMRSISESELSRLRGLKSVDILPAFSQHMIDDFYQGIDVLLFPTQAMESFGLSVREAMLRDVWVIAPDVAGLRSMVQDGVNGFTIPFDNDWKHLLAAIQRTIDHFRRCEGQAIDLSGTAAITSFHDQAQTVAAIYDAVLSSHQS